MKNLYIALSFVITTAMVAQNKDTAAADKLFARYEYVDAAQAYLKLAEGRKADPYVYRMLAESYYNMFNTAEAARWYAKAVESPQDAETYYRYAQMLKSNGQYEQANTQMRKFAQMAPSDQRAVTFLQNPNYVPKLLGKDKLYDIKTLDVNSDNSEFGALLHQNQLYFTSARNTARKTYGWNEQPFLDIYRADYNADGTITNASLVTELNSQYHDGPVSVTADGQRIYFASDSFREKAFERDRQNKLKLGRNNIYTATLDGSKWTNITRLPFNSNEFSTANPSVSRDGKTLYFSSDMPGSIGGVDIWKVSISTDGTYGTPENLGRKVNTEGNESFPFISDDNTTLFFSSNGRQGLGGLDVFRINLGDGSDAQNLGKPINTEKDDFSFSFSSEKNIGFFSSNRNGNDDIFAALPICGVDLRAIVTNAKTGAILAGAKVAIVDDRNNVIETQTADAKGEVSYRVDCDKAYTLQGSMQGFESNTFPVAGQKNGSRKIDVALQPIESIIRENEIALNPIYFEFDKHNITAQGAFELDKLVQVMQANPNMVIMVKSHTDNRGGDKYNMNLSDRRAKSTVQYIRSKGITSARISGKGYGETEPKVDCGANCTEEQHTANRRSEFLIVKNLQ